MKQESGNLINMTNDSKLQLAKEAYLPALLRCNARDNKLVLKRGRLDDAYELGFKAAWQTLEAQLNAPDADKFWWQDADLKLPEYENRKKIDEWEACYASLFRKMNQICSKQKPVKQGELSEAGLEAAKYTWENRGVGNALTPFGIESLALSIQAYLNKTKGKRDE